MRCEPLPKAEYMRRIRKVQEEIRKQGIDVLITYSNETESASSRYLTGFWPFFDFVGIVIPANGEAALVTGGPESYEFALRFSAIENILINPLYVESSAPDWVPEVEGESFATLLPRICGSVPNVVGLSDWNIFPHLLFEDIKEGAPDADIIPADDLLMNIKAIKEDVEIPYIEEAFRITEQAMSAALDACRPGIREYELESIARQKMLELGSEGMPYPAWVCSGPNTPLSLCRSTSRMIESGDLVQFTMGSKFMGYCGNMCRPVFLGSVPSQAGRLMDAAIEATEYVMKFLKPGIVASDVFSGYYDILATYGFENFTLYGPAHGTGHAEVEGLWLSKDADFIIQPNMLFNVDIWLTDGTYGMRYEEGVLITKTGLKQLNNSRRNNRTLSIS
ncbi:MAG: aminopeptidase P family protein [Bacteroidetes bacterium]|nr:aminopeptidase P family protein [Bacteroidota bacterium]